MSSENLDDFAKRSYQPVHRCIYCGKSADLRNEHIVPFALNGVTVLPKSTCGACAEITGRFEGAVLRGPMRDVRVYRGLKSRSGHTTAPKNCEAHSHQEWQERSSGPTL